MQTFLQKKLLSLRCSEALPQSMFVIIFFQTFILLTQLTLVWKSIFLLFSPVVFKLIFFWVFFLIKEWNMEHSVQQGFKTLNQEWTSNINEVRCWAGNTGWYLQRGILDNKLIMFEISKVYNSPRRGSSETRTPHSKIANSQSEDFVQPTTLMPTLKCSLLLFTRFSFRRGGKTTSRFIFSFTFILILILACRRSLDARMFRLIVWVYLQFEFDQNQDCKTNETVWNEKSKTKLNIKMKFKFEFKIQNWNSFSFLSFAIWFLISKKKLDDSHFSSHFHFHSCSFSVSVGFQLQFHFHFHFWISPSQFHFHLIFIFNFNFNFNFM